MPLAALTIIKSLLVFIYKSLFRNPYSRDFRRPDYDTRKLVVFIVLCVSMLLNYLQFNIIGNMLEVVNECGDYAERLQKSTSDLIIEKDTDKGPSDE